MHFRGTIFTLKIEVFRGKYFQEQENTSKSAYIVTKYHPSSQSKCYSFFPRAPLMAPGLRHLQGGTLFSKRLKNSHLWGIVFLTSTPILIKIDTGCKYFTLCESFDAKKFAGTSHLFAC